MLGESSTLQRKTCSNFFLQPSFRNGRPRIGSLTHLDLDFLCSFQEGYSDQEIFGHLCYGVRLKAPQPFQCMVQPHMESSVGKFQYIQKELGRLQDKSWYEIVAEIPWFPFGMVQQGTADRALEIRPRRTSNLHRTPQATVRWGGPAGNPGQRGGGTR